MSQDGICEVEPGLFSMTMAFTDVNFQIAMLEEQKNIFTKYSEFLNYFDPSLHLEINLVTRSMDEEKFRRDTFLPLRGNDRDRYAEEMNQVVAEKALRGQNGLIREKYVTFSLHAENYQQAKEQLENRAADIADHFKRMGSSTRILSGIERLSLLQGIIRPNEEMSFSYDWLRITLLRRILFHPALTTGTRSMTIRVLSIVTAISLAIKSARQCICGA
jgi:orf26 family protein